MARLFVAIDLPDDVKKRLMALKSNIPTARWVNPAQMHLTLRFIGDEIPDKKAQAIKAALGGISMQPFDIILSRVGRFPPGDHKAPRVLWVGIEQLPLLKALHRDVEQALDSVAYPAEGEDFRPHITLARLKVFKPLNEVDDFLKKHADFGTDVITVTEFILYSSVLSPQGPSYTREAQYPLGIT